MLNLIKRILKDERGAYGSVELMFVIGIIVVLATAIMSAFKGDGSTTGLPGAAQDVASKVEDTITGAVK